MSLENEQTLHILKTIKMAKQCAIELITALENRETEAFKRACRELRYLLLTLWKEGFVCAQIDPSIKLRDTTESTLASLERIILHEKHSTERALHKLEFELTPFLNVMYGEFYFWNYVCPDKSRLENYYRTERSVLYNNPYIEQAILDGQYKYDLSIVIMGYNKLDFTRMCTESLLENPPSNVAFELILVNHGSDDGTKEYFESLNPDKQLDIKVNGSANFSWDLIFEGEFILFISNDTIITPHAIDNMLRTMREDKTIGWVVPTTPAVTNNQSVPEEYQDLDGLVKWASANNIYDPFRHEVRTRLCNPICMVRSSSYLTEKGIGYPGRHFIDADSTLTSYPDGHISMLFCRAGYRSVLAKDAFCHHFGSITIKDTFKQRQYDEQKTYAVARAKYIQLYNFDPWGIGFQYNYALAKAIRCKFNGHVEVLGINCGHGSNSLKVKELYKEHRHNLDVSLTNITDNESVIPDLRGVSDRVALIRNLREAFNGERDMKYHYIVIEDPFKGKTHSLSDIKLLYSHLAEGGELYIKCHANSLIGNYKNLTQISCWARVLYGSRIR